jgi:hypothetical protein
MYDHESCRRPGHRRVEAVMCLDGVDGGDLPEQSDDALQSKLITGDNDGGSWRGERAILESK